MAGSLNLSGPGRLLALGHDALKAEFAGVIEDVQAVWLYMRVKPQLGCRSSSNKAGECCLAYC